MLRIILFVMAFMFSVTPAHAQFSATRDAQYMATLKAVVNYKIDDEEIFDDVERLRQNRNFYEKLQKMLNKLNNRRTKDTTNRKILRILEKAGEQIYKELDKGSF